MADAYEVTIESNDPEVTSRIVVRGDNPQQLHDRLTAVVDGGQFALIGAATRCLREDIDAQKALGKELGAVPDAPPALEPPVATTPATKPAEASVEPPKVDENPWGVEQDNAPNLPTLSKPAQTPPASTAPPQSGAFPPAPKWAK